MIPFHTIWIRVLLIQVMKKARKWYYLEIICRNVPDDVLQMVAEKGGIVMVNFFPYFLTDDYPARNATVQVDKKALINMVSSFLRD